MCKGFYRDFFDEPTRKSLCDINGVNLTFCLISSGWYPSWNRRKFINFEIESIEKKKNNFETIYCIHLRKILRKSLVCYRCSTMHTFDNIYQLATCAFCKVTVRTCTVFAAVIIGPSTRKIRWFSYFSCDVDYFANTLNIFTLKKFLLSQRRIRQHPFMNRCWHSNGEYVNCTLVLI